jgi:hypothetical protein
MHALPSTATLSSAVVPHGHTRATRATCGPNTSPDCSQFVTCDPATDPKCVGLNPNNTPCELTYCGVLAVPTCSPASDPECTGIDFNGNPCDPYLASCGPGGNPFAVENPDTRIANIIALHQPQCTDVVPSGTPISAFHQCYTFQMWRK